MNHQPVPLSLSKRGLWVALLHPCRTLCRTTRHGPGNRAQGLWVALLHPQWYTGTPWSSLAHLHRCTARVFDTLCVSFTHYTHYTQEPARTSAAARRRLPLAGRGVVCARLSRHLAAEPIPRRTLRPKLEPEQRGG